ncbi:3592_t:CDS:1, partial [Gigaspora margarita]
QHIAEITGSKNEIDWQATYDLLNYKNQPHTRHTSWEKAKLKVFKVKMLTNKLPVAMNMHIRNPIQNPNATCPRCEKKAKDDWIVCEANVVILDEIIRQAVDRYLIDKEEKKTKQMGNEQVQKYIEKYKAIYMSSESKLKIRIITRKLYNPLGAINDQRCNIELHHNII